MDSFSGQKNWRRSEITIYTDSSKTNNGVGVVFVIYHKNQRILMHSIKLSRHTTVFQAEVYAIYEAAKHLIRETTTQFKYIKILSDSQAALTAIVSDTIKSRTVLDTVNMLKSLKLRTSIVKLAWIKAHVNIEGNEAADEAAKAGANATDIDKYVPKPWCATKAIVRQLIEAEWDSRWKADPQY